MTGTQAAGRGANDRGRKTVTKQAEGLRAFLYDAKAEDKEVDLTEGLAGRLTEDQLLWVDVDLSSSPAVQQLRTLVEIEEGEFDEEERLPIRERRGSFSFTIPTLPSNEDGAELTPLTCIVSTRWLVTAHQEGVEFLDAFYEHVHSDSPLGELDAPNFLASLLEWELNEFFLAMEREQRATDSIEEHILGNELSDRSLDELVARRRRVSYLRCGLSPHRYVYGTLAHASSDVVSGSDAAGDFALLGEHVEQAMLAAHTARELIVGAFDLYMTRMAQRTNNVMRVLTVVSALLLPAALIAGIFGMNMLPDLFMNKWFFGVAIVLMVAVSGGLLTVLVRRGYL